MGSGRPVGVAVKEDREHREKMDCESLAASKVLIARAKRKLLSSQPATLTPVPELDPAH